MPMAMKTSITTIAGLSSDYRQERTKNMTNKKLTGYSRVARIIMGGREYFYALYDDCVNERDSVIVTGTAAGQIWTIDKIYDTEKALNIMNARPTEEIICKVDASAYLDRVSKRRRAIELKTKLNALHGNLIKNISEEYLESICDEYKDLKDQLRDIQNELK